MCEKDALQEAKWVDKDPPKTHFSLLDAVILKFRNLLVYM